MPGNADRITVKRKTIVKYIVILIALAIATPVLADYLGPNRTVTEWSSTCKIVLPECQYVASKNAYRYRQVDDWSCSLESKPWNSYPDQPSSQGCFAATEGDQYWERNEVLSEYEGPSRGDLADLRAAPGTSLGFGGPSRALPAHALAQGHGRFHGLYPDDRSSPRRRGAARTPPLDGRSTGFAGVRVAGGGLPMPLRARGSGRATRNDGRRGCPIAGGTHDASVRGFRTATRWAAKGRRAGVVGTIRP